MTFQLAITIVAALGSCASAILVPYYFGRVTERVKNIRKDVDDIQDTQKEHGVLINEHTTDIARLKDWREGFSLGSMRHQTINISPTSGGSDGTTTVQDR